MGLRRVRWCSLFSFRVSGWFQGLLLRAACVQAIRCKLSASKLGIVCENMLYGRSREPGYETNCSRLGAKRLTYRHDGPKLRLILARNAQNRDSCALAKHTHNQRTLYLGTVGRPRSRHPMRPLDFRCILHHLFNRTRLGGISGPSSAGKRKKIYDNLMYVNL